MPDVVSSAVLWICYVQTVAYLTHNKISDVRGRLRKEPGQSCVCVIVLWGTVRNLNDLH